MTCQGAEHGDDLVHTIAIDDCLNAKVIIVHR